MSLARAGQPRPIDAYVLILDSNRQIDGEAVRFAKRDITQASFWVITSDFRGGRSGSPVFDRDARVIGLMHANKETRRASFAPIQNVQSGLEDRGIVVQSELSALPDWQRYLLLGLVVLIPLLMIFGYVLSRRNRA